MKDITFESSLVSCAALTLAGLKSGSLFNYSFESGCACEQALQRMNAQLNQKGVYIELVKNKGNFYLIYVYRLSALRKDMKDPRIKVILRDFGYHCCEVREYIDHLKYRLLTCECFPHEIGLFLGYPVGDVEGFIKNGGNNCRCCGLWKVYCNECETLKLFARFSICKKIYTQNFKKGVSIYRLTVNTR